MMRRFSIHKRIEGGATIDHLPSPDRLKRFSIHKRIEGGATMRPTYVDIHNMFQYPQTDRRGCNLLWTRWTVELTACFSIHKRIEGGATKVLDSEYVSILIGFSIHKRIEGGATNL